MSLARDFYSKIENETGSALLSYEHVVTYGALSRLEGEIEMLENFYNIRSTTGIKTTISNKKEELKKIKTQHDL